MCLWDQPWSPAPTLAAITVVSAIARVMPCWGFHRPAWPVRERQSRKRPLAPFPTVSDHGQLRETGPPAAGQRPWLERLLQISQWVLPVPGARGGRCCQPRPDIGPRPRSLARRHQVLTVEVTDFDLELRDLLTNVAPALLATKGYGVVTGATLLTAASDKPARLRSEAFFAALCGPAPSPPVQAE
jgi:hypothetical protein